MVPNHNASSLVQKRYGRHLVLFLVQAALLIALSMFVSSQSAIRSSSKSNHNNIDHHHNYQDSIMYVMDQLLPASNSSSSAVVSSKASNGVPPVRSKSTPLSPSSAGMTEEIDEVWKKENSELVDTQPGHSLGNSSSSSSLQIAWLMSYPNSGTSFTLHLVRSTSRRQTATNYASKRIDRLLNKHRNTTIQGGGSTSRQVAQLLQSNSRPVFVDQPMGPFWGSEEVDDDMALPQHYALTKTHCRAPCMWCPPEKYIKTFHYFRGRCSRSERIVTSFPTTNSNHTITTTNNNASAVDSTTREPTTRVTTEIYKDFYPTARVSKSVHLIRDPLDNVVSRFRYERSNHRSATSYPDTREGFRLYCHNLHKEFQLQYRSPGTKFLEESLLQVLVPHVPCYADLIRYIEWHNMAFVTERDMNLDSLVVHYSDYESSTFHSTVSKLMDFLELTWVGQPVKFIESKTYRHHYYTHEEQVLAFRAMKQMALQQTWNHLRRYASQVVLGRNTERRQPIQNNNRT